MTEKDIETYFEEEARRAEQFFFNEELRKIYFRSIPVTELEFYHFVIDSYIGSYGDENEGIEFIDEMDESYYRHALSIKDTIEKIFKENDK